MQRVSNEYDLDPSNFHVFSRDFMRVDVGLMIQRPPIFMTFRKRDAEFLKYKNEIMNEYYANMRPFIDEFEEVSRLNENVIGGNNPYTSKMNIDNYPTHKYKNPETEIESEYCAASKHWSNVDPTLKDRRSLHFAPEDRTYLIL
jgi:hypothetical protein